MGDDYHINNLRRRLRGSFASSIPSIGDSSTSPQTMTMITSDTDSTMKYWIAAGVLGTCIANMFAVKRLRNTNRMRAPFGKSSYESAESKTNAQNHFNEEWFQEQNRKNRDENLRQYKEELMKKSPLYIPPEIQLHLKTLQLPVEFPDKDRIKTSFRELSMVTI